MKKSLNTSGFTLIELLVVIAIIGILSSVVMVAMRNARETAKNSKTLADLKQIRTALSMLEADTGKWPNGCPVDTTGNPEVALDLPAAGIKSLPTVGSYGGSCIWTASDIALWRGPYAPVTVDVWQSSYYFDPDFYTCEEGLTVKHAVIQSYGANREQNYLSSNINAGSACLLQESDDIYMLLK